MLRSLKLILPMFISLLFNNDRGWVHPQTGWEIIINQNMAFYFIESAYLNNAELEEEQTDVIGVFFNDQNIGWGFYSSGFTSISTAGDDGTMPNYPINGDSITFKFYDYSSNQVLNAFSLYNLPLWQENQFFNIQNLYSCSSDYLMLNDGSCVTNCMGDPNLDGQIDILDVIEMIDLIINCETPPNCFLDSLECTDYNNDQMVDIIDIILVINTIL